MEEVKMNRNRMGRVGEMCQERRRGIKVSEKKKKRKSERRRERGDETKSSEANRKGG